VQQLVPEANIVFTGETGADPRDYRVNFDLLYQILPEFRLEYTLEKGMKDLFTRLKAIQFSSDDFHGERFIRLKLLQKNMQKVN
jgi:hypothetical protein